MVAEVDLLGDPIPEGWGKRGRPPHRVTEEKRRLVVQLMAFDWTIERIAAALAVSPPTLRKNYFRELKARAEARARTEAKLYAALMAEAEGGNVAAIDKYLKRLDRHDLGAIAAREQRQAQPPKLGKKEAALADAKTAHRETTWSDLLH